MAILDGPEVRVVETPHGRVRVRDTGGDGPPLLLVHSLLLDPDLYATVVPGLTGRGLPLRTARAPARRARSAAA